MGKNLMTPELVSERERKISDFIVIGVPCGIEEGESNGKVY